MMGIKEGGMSGQETSVPAAAMACCTYLATIPEQRVQFGLLRFMPGQVVHAVGHF